MFGWTKKQAPINPVSHEEKAAVSDTYMPAERTIYKYWNGSELITADPMILFKRLMAAGSELFIDLKVSMSPSKDSTKALDNSIKRVREVFNVKALADGGLTEAETLSLLDHFLEYIDALKKNSRMSPILPMGTSDSSPSTVEENQPTPSTSGSGSTATVRPSDDLTPSPSVPVSPSVPSILA